MLGFLIKIIKKDEIFVYLTVLAFWITILFINPGNKVLTTMLFVWIAIYSFYFKNIRLGVVLGFLLALPFVVGKIYSLEVIPTGDIWQVFYPQGYFETIVIKPINVISVVMAAILVRDLIKRKVNLALKTHDFFLLLTFLFVGLSSFFFSINPSVSSIIFLQLLQIPIFYFYLLAYTLPRKDTGKIFSASLSATIFALFILTSTQYAQGSRIGLSVEISPQEIISPSVFEETFIKFRPFATLYNANSLAAFVLPTLPFFLIQAFFSKSKMALLSFFSASGVLILSLGRSAWLSATVALLITLYWVEVRLKFNVFQFIVKKHKSFLIPVIIALLLSSYLIYPRIIRTLGTLQESGGGYVRLLQAKEALEVISQYKLFGIGLGMSVSYFYQNVPESIVFAFPSQTHNGYLQFALEVGVPALVFLLAFIIVGLYKITNRVEKGLNKSAKEASIAFSCTAGVFAVLINSLFQPFLIQHREPLLEITLLVLFLGFYYSSQISSGKIKYQK